MKKKEETRKARTNADDNGEPKWVRFVLALGKQGSSKNRKDRR